MILHANCKINIGLDILHRREDGFHDLNTVMIPVMGLYDVVEVERVQSPNISFSSLGLQIDCCDDDNLCVRAARLMQQRYNTSGVSITLDKRVPFGAGLGGGSSDATSIILAMNTLYELNLSQQELIDIAAELGSDTAFFVLNTPQLCSGRGEVMTPIELNLAGYTLVLIKPECVNVSTREAYAGVTPQQPHHSLAELIAEPISRWQSTIKNDFEPHIFQAYPLLAQIKEELLRAGAIYAAMSGSGSTIFGLFEGRIEKSAQLNRYTPYIFEL